MNAKIIGGVVASLIIGGVGGYFIGQQNASAATTRGNLQGGAAAFTGRGRGGMNAVFGTIISKDASSITVQLGGPDATSTNGSASGTKLVLYSSSTQVWKTVTSSLSDLSVGQQVVVQGSGNSDGSISAQSIQLRPAGARSQ